MKEKDPKDPNAVALGRKGGKARLTTMTKAQRVASAKKAAKARWPNGKTKRKTKRATKPAKT